MAIRINHDYSLEGENKGQQDNVDSLEKENEEQGELIRKLSARVDQYVLLAGFLCVV